MIHDNKNCELTLTTCLYCLAEEAKLQTYAYIHENATENEEEYEDHVDGCLDVVINEFVINSMLNEEDIHNLIHTHQGERDTEVDEEEQLYRILVSMINLTEEEYDEFVLHRDEYPNQF